MCDFTGFSHLTAFFYLSIYLFIYLVFFMVVFFYLFGLVSILNFLPEYFLWRLYNSEYVRFILNGKKEREKDREKKK